MSDNLSITICVALVALVLGFTVHSCNRNAVEQKRIDFERDQAEHKLGCRDIARRASDTTEDQHCPRTDQKLTIEGAWIRCRCVDTK